MNIVIGIAILLTLMLSDNSTTPDNINIGSRLCGLILLTLIAPFTSTVLVFLAERKPTNERCHDSEFARARFTSSIHTAIWIFSSLAIVIALRWQDVVRGPMGLANWIMVDEILIIAPMLISLVVSWAIFFEQQSHSIPADEKSAARMQYIGLRCRVYLLMVLIPIALVILMKDLWPYFSGVSPAIAGICSIMAIVALLTLMPLVIRMVWTNRSITDDEGRESLLALCHEHQLPVGDIRVWDTDHQIVNALVAGLLPRLRVLMVTDLLLHSFPKVELKAILRHEAGHVRLKHLTTRIGFILLPALSLLAVEMDPNSSLQQFLTSIGIAQGAGLVLGLGFFAYVIWVTAWLSRNMEYEADLYAIGALDPSPKHTGSPNEERNNAARSMADALLRFAEENPDQLTRGSMTHPSLMDRIEMIKTSHSDPTSALAFHRRFVFCQYLLAFGMLVVMAGLIVI